MIIKNEMNVFGEVMSIKKTVGTLDVSVDPRMELLASIQLISDYPTLTTKSFEYKDRINEYFFPYKNHPVIKTFKKLSSKEFKYDAPVHVMLFLSKPLNLYRKSPIIKSLIKKAGGEKRLNRFINEMKDFAIQTNFNNFFKSNVKFYNTLVDKVCNDIEELNLTNEINEYYGLKVNRYNLILAPLFESEGYGSSIKTHNGLNDVYGILGTSEVEKVEGYENVPVYSNEDIRCSVWREFSYSLVNHNTEKHTREIKKYKKLFNPIKDIMKAQSYGRWDICVNEHIVRAVTSRLAYIHLGEKSEQADLNSDKSMGFYYIEDICEKLEYYEKNRDKYPTFESFYPKLIDVFRKFSEKKSRDDFYSKDFKCTINAAFFSSIIKNNITIIIPSNESDTSIQNEIVSNVNKVKDKFKFLKRAKILSDKDALTEDLSNSLIMCFGTMEGNLWLAKYKCEFPFTIESDKIIADKTYEDNNLLFISTMPNPQNINNPLIIYTAQQAKDVLNILSNFDDLIGPTDYIIAKKDEQLYAANYIKNNDKWKF